MPIDRSACGFLQGAWPFGVVEVDLGACNACQSSAFSTPELPSLRNLGFQEPDTRVTKNFLKGRQSNAPRNAERTAVSFDVGEALG